MQIYVSIDSTAKLTVELQNTQTVNATAIFKTYVNMMLTLTPLPITSYQRTANTCQLQAGGYQPRAPGYQPAITNYRTQVTHDHLRPVTRTSYEVLAATSYQLTQLVRRILLRGGVWRKQGVQQKK